jgi:hypothetical protein
VTDRTCSIVGCSNPSRSRGWCIAHYARWLRTGSTELHRAQQRIVVGEKWLPVAGYKGCYEVSDHGRVRSLDRDVRCTHNATRRIRGQLLTPRRGSHGYFAVSLSKHDKRTVHTLVLEAFIGPCPPGMECCHGPAGPADNRLSNLSWGTRSKNMIDTLRDGTNYARNRTHCPRDHALQGPNLTPSIAAAGRRGCLACSRAQSRERYAKRCNRPFDFKATADAYYKQIMATWRQAS